MAKEFLTVDEVAEVLRVSRWSVIRYIKAGALDATKAAGPNGSYRIPLSSVHAYIQAHTVTAEETR